MKRFTIQTNTSESSEILCEEGIFSEMEERAEFIFTDSNVDALYGKAIREKFGGVPVFAMPAGEEHKNKETLFALLGEMKNAGLHRGDTLVCIGGGVVGDVGGLASALYMRGIGCIQVPTTLLSQVDSSVGGKTAIDFGGVKNLIGAFCQPKKVYVDGSFLKTLPAREIRCGLGEIVKHAALSESLFETLWNRQDELFSTEFLSEIIPENIAIKADVVRRDAHEQGLRKCLNLGHTTAHAFELSDGKLSHGEYVLIGILFESKIALEYAHADKEYLKKLCLLAKKALGEVRELPSAEEAVSFARLDKKNESNNQISLTVPVREGEFAFLQLSAEEYAAQLRKIRGTIC